MHSSESMSIEEGSIEVPGASLRYRRVHGEPQQPVLVFENGWGASYHYWAWVQRELAPHAQLLFYNRAGIAGSTITAPKTPATISAQLDALLSRLGLADPVVIVGQSYGGLMCALHAAQMPQRVRAFVQVDSTPERAQPEIDRTLGLVRAVTRLTMLLARLRLPDPLYGPAAAMLPPEDGRLLMETAFGSVTSLRNALDELKLIGALRAAIARGGIMPPRLAISAGGVTESKGLLRRLIASPEKARAILKIMEQSHRDAAATNGRWMSLPYTHGDLVFSEPGAIATSAQVLEFARSLR
jgi:pimeloyl-ACP methyl ester carboxylesterase